MQWMVIIVLTVVVVVLLAYALGVYVRQKQGDLPDAPLISSSPKKPSPVRAIGDREVRAVVNWLLSQAFEQTGVKVADDKIAFQRIVEAAEVAVQELKSQDSATVSLPFLTADATGPKHLEARLTRSMIEELVKY
jgi:hypothetical protein